jgi:hypothetical protein
LYCSGQVLFRLYLTRDLGQLGIPVACVVVGSLTHAAFEDWLVAVGYHMTVLFWLLALCLPDLVLRSGTRSATPDLLQQPG